MSTLRRVVVMAGAIGLCGLLVTPRTAGASTTATGASGSAQITFTGRATDGSRVKITEQLSEIALSHYSPGSPDVAAGRGNAYLSFYAPGGTSDNTRPAFDGIDGVGTSAVHVVLPDGSVVPAKQPMSPLGSLLLGTYYFLVPSSTRSATLEVSSGSYDAVEYVNGPDTGGELTTINFGSARALLVVPTAAHQIPAIRATPTSAPAPRTKAASSRESPNNSKAVQRAVGFVNPLAIGAGTGAGAVVLVLLVPMWRRRTYRRADAQGRVVIDSPPLLLSPSTPPVSDRANGSKSPPSVVVEVLGPVEVDGLVEPFKKSPVREVLVFLALHPGRRFTTIELRSSIWVEGRNEPNAATFRNYLSALRRSLPPETLTKKANHYALTDAVTTDWGRFCAVIADDPRGPEALDQALDLIRGTPFEGASSGRNSPYGWSSEIAHRIEATVETAAHELATFGLESSDPAFADVGVTQALRCVPTSFVVRDDHIRLGMVLGGRRELRRRMQAARVALGDDVSILEPTARELGWETA